MNKEAWEDNYEMETEYDFSNSVPNPYAARFREGTTQILLDPDVYEVFPDSESVNAALRMVMRAGARAASSKMKVKRAS
ncbi:MAG: hypothetical protein ABI286_07140 [Edaphobacter sp.]